MDKRTTDIVAYLSWIGLIIAFVTGDRKASRFHLNQALVIWLVGTVCGLVPKFGWIGSLFCALCWFIGFINALQGVEQPVPVLGRIRIL